MLKRMLTGIGVLTALSCVCGLVAQQATERGKSADVVDDETPVHGTVRFGAEVTTIDGADAIEEAIRNRVGETRTLTRTRVFDAGQTREFEGAENRMDRANATFDAADDSFVVRGKYRGLDSVEDVRFVEENDIVYVLRDLYAGNDPMALFAGRSIPIELEPSADGRFATVSASDNNAKVAALAAAVPEIKSFDGVDLDASGIRNGRAAMGCGDKYNGAMVVNDRSEDNIEWTILGSNFGTKNGTVRLAGRTAKIVEWTPNRIRMVPTISTSSGPMTALLTLKTSTGSSKTTAQGIVPAIRTRVFGQCTHYCARKRIELGQSPSHGAFDSNGTIDASYRPMKGDQYQWKRASDGLRHVAIVIGVSGPTPSPGGYSTWKLTIGEYNSKCDASYNSYSTTFQTQTTASGTKVIQFPSDSRFGKAAAFHRDQSSTAKR